MSDFKSQCINLYISSYCNLHILVDDYRTCLRNINLLNKHFNPASRLHVMSVGIFLPDQKKLFNAPTEARTILEALEQRLEKYQASCNQAKGEGNNSKARRMGRIVKVKHILNKLEQFTCCMYPSGSNMLLNFVEYGK